jgi:hypothetical protein
MRRSIAFDPARRLHHRARSAPLLVFPPSACAAITSIATLGIGEIVSAGDPQLGEPDPRRDGHHRAFRRWISATS